jgi:hypothetical protein
MKATIEIEVELPFDTLEGIAQALIHAAGTVKLCTVVRKGLGMYLIDRQGNDIGCVALFGGARDFTLEEPL